jgi:hypothetical protein
MGTGDAKTHGVMLSGRRFGQETVARAQLGGPERRPRIAVQVGSHPTATHPVVPGLSVNGRTTYIERMNVEELRDLSGAARPLSVFAVAPGARDRVVAYNDLVFGFRERVVRARSDLVLGRRLDPELVQELRLLASELPGLLRRAEAAAERELAVLGE